MFDDAAGASFDPHGLGFGLRTAIHSAADLIVSFRQ
jgi:hypothetical protein